MERDELPGHLEVIRRALIIAIAVAGCAHDRVATAQHLHVAGRVVRGCSTTPDSAVSDVELSLTDAVGTVLAEARSSPDGQYVLDPHNDRELHWPLHVGVAGKDLVLPRDDHAEWLRSGWYELTIQLPCAARR